MKLSLILTLVVAGLLGTAAPTYAKQEQQVKGHKKHQQQAKGQQEQQAHQPSQQGPRLLQGEQRGVWRQYRARNWKDEHRTWRQRGGYHGYRIPEDHFHGYFGRNHGFRIYKSSLVFIGGYPRFQYGGFFFGIIDPWPEYWSDDWYENDDVYIDYSGDGYYLYNRRHPGVGIAVNVFVN